MYHETDNTVLFEVIVPTRIQKLKSNILWIGLDLKPEGWERSVEQNSSEAISVKAHGNLKTYIEVTS